MKDVDLLRLELFGYGFRIRFMKGNYDPKKGDGSIEKYSIGKSFSKYNNPYFMFSLNYNYDFVFYLQLNKS